MRGDETKIIKKRESVQFLIFFFPFSGQRLEDWPLSSEKEKQENVFVAQQSGSTASLCQTVDKPQIQGTVHRFHFIISCPWPDCLLIFY